MISNVWVWKFENGLSANWWHFFTRKLMINHWILGYILIFTHKVWPALNGDISWFNLSHLVGVSMCFQSYFFIRDGGLYGLSSMFEGWLSTSNNQSEMSVDISSVTKSMPNTVETCWKCVSISVSILYTYAKQPSHISLIFFFLVGIVFWEQPLDHLVAEVSMCSPTQWYIAKTRRSYGAWFWWEHLQHIMATLYPGDPCN